MNASRFLLVSAVCSAAFCQAQSFEPPLDGRSGTTFYVSKLGANTDGLSWAAAFNSIQAALEAIPDGEGGHRIYVRPDTYMEANLFTAFKGAPGAYNLLEGDMDGSLGSGRAGWVVIDSGDPGRGFKSYDWWGTLKAYKQGWSKEHNDASFSAICWDRWVLRNLYVSGGDGGFMWDCVDKIEPFTVVVEDCVSIGRAFGGGVGSCLARRDEPIVFRRCNLWALDWWGDTAAAYVRIENETMPDHPEVFFEDCTMVSPQCALKGGNYGFHTYTRVKTVRCNLAVLNFSQPAGTPSDGIVTSMQNGKYFHVDFEDTALMGYKVFGVKVDKDSAGDIGYTCKGDVRAYLQFQQDEPKGFRRSNYWPAELFAKIAPPAPRVEPVPLRRDSERLEDLCEVSPVVWKDRLCLMKCMRPASGGDIKDYYLSLMDAETKEEMARFAEGYGLACAFAHDGVFHAFASRYENNNWNDVTLFSSSDLVHWEKTLVIQQENEHLFNSSVCATPDGFAMAYESNEPAYPAFTTKFAVSKDMQTWTKAPEATFGTNRYTACPCIRYADGYYYVIYLEHRTPAWRFESYITRSNDLKHWELSAANPVLTAELPGDGINASDVDLVEFGGKTWMYYCVADQLTWADIVRTAYDGPLGQFLGAWFAAPGIPDAGAFTAKMK